MTIDNSATKESSRESYDDFASALQRLRLEAGPISYTELADRITQNRESQGMTPAMARVAKSSVYDVFRPGRKRVNPELVEEITRALGQEEHEVRAWRQRALAARDDSVKPTPRSPFIGAEANGLLTLLAVVLCVAVVGLNHALNFSVSALHVPLYLDMVGTAFAAFAFGPWAGAAVGIGTNLVGNFMNGDFSGWWFALVQVAGAVVWGYGFRRWFGRGPWRFFLLNVLVAVVCSLVAVPIILFAFTGTELLHGAAALAKVAQELGAGLAGAVFSVNMLTSLADKLISGYLAFCLLRFLKRRGFPLAEPRSGSFGNAFGSSRRLNHPS